ncbi:MAG: hypothetical protein K6E27_00070 [Eubacterium sp.]|nr:hypothetical protein [Eubacterium sp.]
MNIEYIIMCMSIIVQAVIGYESGDLVANALLYNSSRGRVLGDAVIMLIMIVIRYLLDRWLILGRERAKSGFSPIILDVAAFVLGTFTSLITLEMYATETVPVTLAVLLLVVFFSVLYEKDIYVRSGDNLTEEDPYLMEDTPDENPSDADDDYEIILEDVTNETEELVIENWTEESSKKSNGIKKSDSIEVTGDSESKEEAIVTSDAGIKIYIAEIVRLLASVSSVMVAVLILCDIVAEKFSPLYYALVGLVALLAVVLRAVTRGLDALIKNPDKKVHFVGYSVIVVIYTIFLCTRSVLIGLVFLLGAYLVKLIIPMALNNWGTGGTEVVKQKIDILSRFVTRLFILIILILGVWMLSYGAIWEIDFMAIFAIAIGTGELLMKQNIE